MKKNLTIITLLMLTASIAFSQTAQRRIPVGKRPAKQTLLNQQRNVTQTPPAKTAGDTIAIFPWTEGFEGTSAIGFTFIDNDNDGFNWSITNYNTLSHTGDGFISSASYDNDSHSPLTPDNWMILPTFVIPSDTTEYLLSWYDKGQDPNYAAEFYSVYISTTGNSISDFISTTAVYSDTSTSEWVKRTVNLTAYAGQTINIAFRHHNITDMFLLDIDDIRVGGQELPELTLVGPRSTIAGDTNIYIASTDGTLSWTANADFSHVSGDTAILVWDSIGTYNVIATATNSAGSVSDTIVVNVIECTPITTIPFSENFETEIPCWRTISMNSDNDEEFGIFHGEEALQGEGYFQFSSYIIADDYNQYLISPEIVLPTEGSYMLKFYYYATSSYESFRVLSSSNTAAIEDFTTEISDIESTVSEEWVEMAVNIPAGTKYLAFNYYADWSYQLRIDSLTIEGLTAPNITLAGPEEIGTGNPATFVATSTLAESFSWTIDGNAVNESGNILTYTFTTTGEHTITVTGTNSIGTSQPATLTVNVFNCNGTTLPYVPDFSEGLRCWTSRCDLTEGMGWYASVDIFDSNPIGQVLSFSAESFYGMFIFDVDVDNWLFSPVIAMPENGNHDIAWKVMPYTTEYPGDHYGVYVINENNEETLLFEETLDSTMTGFQQRTVTIPSSVTGNIRIAFRHFNSENGYVIILDDIQITGTVGINEVNSSNAVIYPNPATGEVTVKGEGIVNVQIFDVNGRNVISSTRAGQIDISSLSSGIYMVRIVTTNGVTTQKLNVK